MALIEVSGVSFSYRQKTVLSDISLDFESGTVVALLGPNGGGKTTLLKLILGLLKPDSGTVAVCGRDIRSIKPLELARMLAYVPQVHKESFAYHVMDVVMMGRMPHKSFFAVYNLEDRNMAETSLEKLGIAHLAERPYTEISGGERQLVLIARAMTQGARVFIMDEPTNGLDFGNQIRLLERLKLLSQEGFTFIFSTHHPDHVMAVADRVIMMQNGRTICDGVVNEAFTDKSLKALYQIDVRLFAVEEGVNVCVPAMRFND